MFPVVMLFVTQTQGAENGSDGRVAVSPTATPEPETQGGTVGNKALNPWE